MDRSERRENERGARIAALLLGELEGERREATEREIREDASAGEIHDDLRETAAFLERLFREAVPTECGRESSSVRSAPARPATSAPRRRRGSADAARAARRLSFPVMALATIAVATIAFATSAFSERLRGAGSFTAPSPARIAMEDADAAAGAKREFQVAQAKIEMKPSAESPATQAAPSPRPVPSETVYRLLMLKAASAQEARDFKLVLESMGYLPVYIIPTPNGPLVYYGNFANRNDAVKMKAKLERDGFTVESIEQTPRQMAAAANVAPRAPAPPRREAAGPANPSPERRAVSSKIAGEAKNLTPAQRKAIDDLIDAKLKASGAGGASASAVNEIIALEKKLNAVGGDVSRVREHVESLNAGNEESARKRVSIAQKFREADSLAKSGRVPEAIAATREILNADPGNAIALNRLRMLESMGQGEAFEGSKEMADNQVAELKAMAQQEEARGTLASLVQAKTLWQQIATIHERYAPDASARIATLDAKIAAAQSAEKAAESAGILGGLARLGERLFGSDPKPAPTQVASAVTPAPTCTPMPSLSPYPTQTPIVAEADMYFVDHGVNPFVDAGYDNLSTFAIDVDTASYTMARDYLNRGAAPPAAAIRVEEVVNHFRDNYAPPQSEAFAVYGSLAPSPFGPGLHLLRVGVKGREIPPAERKPVILTFVIDVSGSMEQGGRLELVKRTLRGLVSHLRPEDRIGIATFDTVAQAILPHRAVGDSEAISAAIGSLHPGGSTNAAQGLQIGYEMARAAFSAGAVNRVILCSDGVANTGVTDAESIRALVAKSAGANIYLTSVGVGMGNYNDALMEELADKGNGHYAYLNDDAQARAFIQDRLIGSMEVVAQDVKIQAAFNRAAVARYRLIGFEGRDVADADFRNDAVDAGEIGSGHSVTALYELELRPGSADDVVADIAIRFKQPDYGMAAREVKGALRKSAILVPFERADDHFKLAACAAEYGEILRNSCHAAGSRMSDVARIYDAAFPVGAPGDADNELRRLIDAADPLTRNRPSPRAPREAPRAIEMSGGPSPIRMD